MKKILTAAILAAVMIWGMAGCAPGTTEPAATGTAAVMPAETAATLQPSLGPLAELAGIHAADVRQIDMYGDSQPPDTPVAVCSADEDIALLLAWLQSIRTTEALAAPTSTAPGDWSRYDVALFDGSTITVSFSGDTVSTDGTQFRYTGPEAPDLGKQLWLDVDGASFPAGTETIYYTLNNTTGTEAVILFVPVLERAADTGWEKLECTEGFCGVPDPATEPVIEHDLPLADWYPDAGPGVYRLSLEAYDEDDNPFMISDVFEIG